MLSSCSPMYYKYNLFLSKTVRKNRYKIKKNIEIANYNVEYKNVIVNLNFSEKIHVKKTSNFREGCLYIQIHCCMKGAIVKLSIFHQFMQYGCILFISS